MKRPPLSLPVLSDKTSPLLTIKSKRRRWLDIFQEQIATAKSSQTRRRCLAKRLVVFLWHLLSTTIPQCEFIIGIMKYIYIYLYIEIEQLETTINVHLPWAASFRRYGQSISWWKLAVMADEPMQTINRNKCSCDNILSTNSAGVLILCGSGWVLEQRWLNKTTHVIVIGKGMKKLLVLSPCTAWVLAMYFVFRMADRVIFDSFIWNQCIIKWCSSEEQCDGFISSSMDGVGTLLYH